MSLLLSNATVLTGDDEGTVLRGCDIVVREGRFAALGTGLGGEHADRTIDAGDLLVMPGLINGHTHSPETLAKGRADRSALDVWLREIWPPLDALTERQIQVAALLGAAEMLRTGAIAVVDHFRQTPATAAAVDAVAAAYRQSGLRAVIAVMLRDVKLDPSWKLPPAREQVDIVANAHRSWAEPGGRLRFAVAPSAPTRCSDDLLVAAGALVERHGLLFHTHVDEVRGEGAEAHERYGTSNVGHLADLGLLSPSTSLAHAIWLDDADIDLLARSGAAVVHNPVSNMRLGSGIAPVTAMRERGVAVTIGTDGAASNDGQSVVEAVKAAALLQRVSGVEPDRWFTGREVLSFATSVPARVFGFGGGRIEKGAPADFIAVRRSGYAFAPSNDWHRQVVFGAGGLDVRFAVVDGDLLLDDGRITTFDEAEILAEARAIGPKIFAPHDGGTHARA